MLLIGWLVTWKSSVALLDALHLQVISGKDTGYSVMYISHTRFSEIMSFNLFQSLLTGPNSPGIRIPCTPTPNLPRFNRVRDQTPQLVELFRSAQFPGHGLCLLSQRRGRACDAGLGELCRDVLELAVHLVGV